MFIDQVKIEVRSGKGGDGMIAFLREKYMPWGGPSGGNGGRGGSIYFRANKNINTLFNFRHSKTIIAQDGENGGPKNKFGKYASDVFVDVPVGTVVYLEPDHTFLCDLDKEGKTFLIAKGGRGGRGNACFKSSTNRAPKIAENGEPGEIKKLTLELKLLADVGLVGFPSVGKSTLLSLVSNARPEIADYPFTTLEPNLGVVYLHDGNYFLLADLPGLIKGAHLGKGLGLTFLRHVQRCRLICYVISMDGFLDPIEQFNNLKEELKQYGYNLDKRPYIIVASKMDEDGAYDRLEHFKKTVSGDIYPISALTNENVDKFIEGAYKHLLDAPNLTIDDIAKTSSIKVYKLDDEESFKIDKINADTYRIYGEKIEKYYQMVNLTTDEGMLKLISHLRRIGVDDKLEEMGAKNGDTVILCDFQFEYIA